MNKSYVIGFTVVDSIIASISATKRGVVHAAKATARGAVVSVQTTKSGAISTSEAVTSFFAGARQAAKLRRGTCRVITYDVRSDEE